MQYAQVDSKRDILGIRNLYSILYSIQYLKVPTHIKVKELFGEPREPFMHMDPFLIKKIQYSTLWDTFWLPKGAIKGAI